MLKASDHVPSIISFLEANDSTLNEALDFVSGSSGVSVAALRSAWYRSAFPKQKQHGNNKLKDEQETILTCLFLSFSAASLPLKPSRATWLVKELFDIEVDRSWSSRWVTKHEHEMRI